jgi:hypothetical protein
MNKGRLMELLGLNLKTVDTELPRSFIEVMLDSQVSNPERWFAWYQDKPIHLGEELYCMLNATKVTLKHGSEMSLMDLIEAIIAHPEDVEINFK